PQPGGQSIVDDDYEPGYTSFGLNALDFTRSPTTQGLITNVTTGLAFESLHLAITDFVLRFTVIVPKLASSGPVVALGLMSILSGGQISKGWALFRNS